MSTGKTGVSRRAYAKSRKISEATVRKYLADGRLSGALLSDGSIDPAAADRLLAASAPRNRNQPISLVTAKMRRLRAQVRRLDDEVKELQRRLIHIDDVVEALARSHEEIVPYFRSIAAKAAPIVAGMNGRDAHAALQDAVNAAMGDIHVRLSSEPAPRTAVKELELDDLSETDLQATKLNLEALKIEIERARAKQVLRDQDEIRDEANDAAAVTKSMMLAIPGRLAILMEGASRDQARQMIEDEVEQALRPLFDLQKRYREAMLSFR